MRLLKAWGDKLEENRRLLSAESDSPDPLTSPELTASFNEIKKFGAEARTWFVDDDPSELIDAIKDAERLHCAPTPS